MKDNEVPDPAVRRISLYLRSLEQLAGKGVQTVSSRQLAQRLHLSDAQVRRDLTYFGQFGRPGVGYPVVHLAQELRRALGADRVRRVILVGAGNLGRALLRFRGFPQRNFQLVAAFDISASKVGRKIGSIPVRHIDKLAQTVRRQGVRLAILTVPAEAAQDVVPRLCQAGIRGILNFAPTVLDTPAEVTSLAVDLAASLEQLSFQVDARLQAPLSGPEKPRSPRRKPSG